MIFNVSEKDKRKNKIWNILPDDIWSSSKILDCASGDGRKGIQYYMQQGVDPKNVIAIDAQDQILEKLRWVGVKAYCVDLEKTDICDVLTDERFDIILCSETLEHLSERAEKILCRSFIDLINPGGYIIITFPNNLVIERSVKKYGHIRQPKVNKLLKKLSPLFEKSKVIRYKKKNKKGNSTSIMVFSRKI